MGPKGGRRFVPGVCPVRPGPPSQKAVLRVLPQPKKQEPMPRPRALVSELPLAEAQNLMVPSQVRTIIQRILMANTRRCRQIAKHSFLSNCNAGALGRQISCWEAGAARSQTQNRHIPFKAGQGKQISQLGGVCYFSPRGPAMSQRSPSYEAQKSHGAAKCCCQWLA